MTTMPPEDHFELPTGVTEDDLLDWIESDAKHRATALEGSSVHRVERALTTLPALRVSLEAMRVDRAALGALELPAPPAWMTQSILEEHERQALLALSDIATLGKRGAARAQSEGEAFTLSAMPGWFRPALAIAAVLALAFGAWQLVPLMLRPTVPQPGPVIVSNGQESPPVALPHVEPPQGDFVPEPMLVGPVPMRIEPSSSDRLAQWIDLPAADAIALARAGRLMLVVEVPAIEPAREAALAIAAAPAGPAWRLREPSDLLLAAVSGPRHSITNDRMPAERDFLIADRGPLGQIDLVLSTLPTIYVAEASSTPEALLQLIEAMGRLGNRVRVVTLDEPLPDSGTLPTPANAATLLWWDETPDTWRPWTGIAIQFVKGR
ncbi:MAG: hypothetical protein KIT54_11925 [Phycisphaeraceae bacterium]|nr:hypothetical protein [Phycisphaeraceae bacterium]